MTRIKGTEIPDPFVLTDATREWLQKRYPNVDEELAIERFTAWASNYSYANWQRTFQNWLMRTDDDKKLGPVLKRVQPKSKGDELKERARAMGFREPFPGETYSQFEAALDEAGRQKVRLVQNAVGAMFK